MKLSTRLTSSTTCTPKISSGMACRSNAPSKNDTLLTARKKKLQWVLRKKVRKMTKTMRRVS